MKSLTSICASKRSWASRRAPFAHHEPSPVPKPPSLLFRPPFSSSRQAFQSKTSSCSSVKSARISSSSASGTRTLVPFFFELQNARQDICILLRLSRFTACCKTIFPQRPQIMTLVLSSNEGVWEYRIVQEKTLKLYSECKVSKHENSSPENCHNDGWRLVNFDSRFSNIHAFY